ncbi:MAG: right-handed parallel beta-helix repeat-containing protein [Saprospiraceae bacterium]|nr:right-handed parallel beta-helix repeat-containing protein [Saprospiraceae bacterium]
MDGNRDARGCEENYAHSVIMVNCSQIQISNTTIRNSVVDGILIGAGTEGDTSTYCRDISIENVKIESSCRNGISIINAFGVKLKQLQISNSNGLSPAAGIDVESDLNLPTPSNKNIVITDCQITDNKGCGIMTSQKGSPENIQIANNIIVNCEIGIFVASKKTKVENNNIKNSFTFGIQSVRYDNEDIDFNEITHNVIEKAKVGIHYSGEKGKIVGNKIITVSQSGIWLNGNTVNNTSVLIDSNEVTGSVEFGIYANNFGLSEISNNTVSSAAKEGISVINGKSKLMANAISKSETGFNITGSNIELSRNIVESCQTGVSAIGGNKISLSGKIYQNKFIKVKNLWFGDINKFAREANEEIK